MGLILLCYLTAGAKMHKIFEMRASLHRKKAQSLVEIEPLKLRNVKKTKRLFYFNFFYDFNSTLRYQFDIIGAFAENLQIEFVNGVTR